MLAGLGLGWALRQGPTDVATVGRPAPDFTVELIDGGSFTLSEAKGRVVVLNFWASWCGPCRTEIPEISAFAESRPEIQVIGVAVDDVESEARAFAAEIAASYPLALGTPQVEDAYPRIGLPVTYIIDERGVVAQVHNGIVDRETLAELVG